MTLSYNLVDMPAVLVAGADGSQMEMGFRPALTEAHRHRGLRDPLPTAEFGMYRLLTALVLDIFFLEEGKTFDSEALADLLGEGRFDAGRIDAYFAKYANRFDLFHPQHPFLQIGGMEGEEKPLAGLVNLQPSGTNAGHFHHVHEDEFGVCPAAAARLLTTIAPFMTAGGAGLSPSINGAPPWYVLPVGRNLFETICLNLCARFLSMAKGEELPAWRSNRSVGGGVRRAGASYAESLTWRPRRILLIPGGPGRCSLTGAESETIVRVMRFTAGDSCDFAWRDPNCAYRIGNDAAVILRPQEGKEVWRDTGPLALLQKGDYGAEDSRTRFERPALIDQFGDLVERKVIEGRPRLDLHLYGMRGDMKMKIFEWQRERLSLPTALIWNSAFHRAAQTEIETADAVAYQIKQAIKRMYPRDGGGNKNALATAGGSAEREFWATLRPAYEAFLDNLAPLNPERDAPAIAAARADWSKTLRARGGRVMEAAIDEFDTDADALQRQARTRRLFYGEMFKIFAAPEEKAAKGGKGKRQKAAVTDTALPGM